MQHPMAQGKHSENNPWLFGVGSNPNARTRLICFPYAGGNAGVFRQWANLLSKDVEVVSIQYPGRATRFKEPLISDMQELVEAIFAACGDYFNQKPFVFFGHSMGASVAWELCHKLKNAGLSLPELLIVSGRRAPRISLPEDYRNIHELPKQEFIERLKKLNGTPQELLEHEDLMDLMEPIIRNDFKLVESWVPDIYPPLATSIHVFGSEEDQHINQDSLSAWALESEKHCEFSNFPGDHFYLHQHEEKLLERLNQLLAQI